MWSLAVATLFLSLLSWFEEIGSIYTLQKVNLGYMYVQNKLDI